MAYNTLKLTILKRRLKMKITQEELNTYQQKMQAYLNEHEDDSTYWGMVREYNRLKQEYILQPIRDNIGKFISLNGKPISRQRLYRIMGINEDGDIKLRPYRGKRILLMRSYNVQKESPYWYILTDEEFDELPESII
jgi:hypothetical protein